jgi:hypothetical protein
VHRSGVCVVSHGILRIGDVHATVDSGLQLSLWNYDTRSAGIHAVPFVFHEFVRCADELLALGGILRTCSIAREVDALLHCVWCTQALTGNETCCGFQGKFNTISKLTALSLVCAGVTGTCAVFSVMFPFSWHKLVFCSQCCPQMACWTLRIWPIVGIASAIASAGFGGLCAFLLYTSAMIDPVVVSLIVSITRSRE